MYLTRKSLFKIPAPPYKTLGCVWCKGQELNQATITSLASCIPLNDPERCDHIPRLTGHKRCSLVHHQPEVLPEGILEREGDGSVVWTHTTGQHVTPVMTMTTIRHWIDVHQLVFTSTWDYAHKCCLLCPYYSLCPMLRYAKNYSGTSLHVTCIYVNSSIVVLQPTEVGLEVIL